VQKLGKAPGGLTAETVAAVAQSLEVSPRDVVEMDRRLAGDLSLNAPVGNDGAVIEWGDTLLDGAPDAEAIVAEQDQSTRRKSALHATLDVLTERERRVFEARRLTEEPPTLDELGREMSISSEHVRQIETRAFAKVKRAAGQNMRARGQVADVDVG
jgi:RNA polymerase sigma-32 factor